jgi:hypothetical protein
MAPKFPAKRYIPGLGKFFDVRSDEIDPKAVETLELDDASVTNIKLAGNITGDKLRSSAVGQWETANVVSVDVATYAGPVTLLASDATQDRLVLVQAIVSLTATGTPQFDVGDDGGAPTICFSNLGTGVLTEGERYIGACRLGDGLDLICTVTTGGAATGTILFLVLELDVTVLEDQIASGAVTNDKLAGSISPDKLVDNVVGYVDTAAEPAPVAFDTGSPVTLLASDANLDRLVLVEAITTVACAGSPKFDVGYTGTLTGCFDNLGAGTFGVGETLLGLCILPATKDLICTITKGASTAGQVRFRVRVVTPTVETNQIAANAVTTAKILDANVTAAKLANGAGIAALVAAGLGNSVVQLYADKPTKNVLASVAHDRAVLVIAICLTKPVGTIDHATVEVGYPAALDAFLTVAQMDAVAGPGSILVGAGILPSGKTLDATIANGGTADVNDDASFAITVLALSTS